MTRYKRIGYHLYGMKFRDKTSALQYFNIRNKRDLAWHRERSEAGLAYMPNPKMRENPEAEKRRRKYFEKVLRENGFINE